MVKDYIINFWVWWYFVQAKDFIASIYRLWIYILGRLNVVPMLSNLFVPLYQDYSIIGRFMSFIIRSIWGFGGGVIFLLFGIPLLLTAIIYLVLPFLIVIQIIRFFI